LNSVWWLRLNTVLKLF